MVEIIPTIIPQNVVDLAKKLALVEDYVEWVHVDIMDGNFVKQETFRDPIRLRSVNTKAKIELHLMVWEPEKTMHQWVGTGAKRFVIHFESTYKRKELAEQLKESGLQSALAVNPETPYEFIEEYVPSFDMIQVMTVKPGLGGQEFMEDMLPKIKSLRRRFPNKPISVDGGINPVTAKKAIDVGANVLLAGSFIYKHKNIKEGLEELKMAVSGS